MILEDLCRSKDNLFNKLLVVVWSSLGCNYFIFFVGIKGRFLFRFLYWLIFKVWGIFNEVVKTYVEFDKDGYCFIGGDRCF